MVASAVRHAVQEGNGMAAEEGVPARIIWPDDSMWPQGGYSNTFLINHTPWDFTIRFGHVVLPVVPPGTPLPRQAFELAAAPIAQLTMPPAAFRQLALAIQEQVAGYRAQYGDIGGAPPEQGLG